MNLNDKLEYNRSTIPFPDDKPPTDDEIKTDKNVKAKIGNLRTEYQHLKAEAKSEKESQKKPKTKTKRKTKQKPTLSNEPNPLTMVMRESIDFDKMKKMRDAKINDWLLKDNMNFDIDLDLEWRWLNMINLYDNDLDPSNMAMTNDHLDIDFEYNQMTETKLDCGSSNESQHDNALRKLKYMHASCISDWISNDKDKSIVNIEMKPFVVDTCSIDNKDSNIDAVLTETPICTHIH